MDQSSSYIDTIDFYESKRSEGWEPSHAFDLTAKRFPHRQPLPEEVEIRRYICLRVIHAFNQDEATFYVPSDSDEQEQAKGLWEEGFITLAADGYQINDIPRVERFVEAVGEIEDVMENRKKMKQQAAALAAARAAQANATPVAASGAVAPVENKGLSWDKALPWFKQFWTDYWDNGSGSTRHFIKTYWYVIVGLYLLIHYL